MAGEGEAGRPGRAGGIFSLAPVQSSEVREGVARGVPGPPSPHLTTRQASNGFRSTPRVLEKASFEPRFPLPHDRQAIRLCTMSSSFLRVALGRLRRNATPAPLPPSSVLVLGRGQNGTDARLRSPCVSSDAQLLVRRGYSDTAMALVAWRQILAAAGDTGWRMPTYMPMHRLSRSWPLQVLRILSSKTSCREREESTRTSANP